MRLAAEFAVLFSLLASSCWAHSEGPVRKPSDIKLNWLKKGVAMKITFADKRTDEVFLKRDPNDDCMFQGSLKSDIESEVEVDGCTGDFEIVEISSRLVPCGLVTLVFEDGETYEIDPFEAIIPADAGDSRVIEVVEVADRRGNAWSGALPATAVAKIHVRYDTKLLEMVGGKHAAAKKKINKIIKLARPYFRSSMGLAMDIEIEVLSGPSYYDQRLQATENGLRWLNNLGERYEPTAWFTAPQKNWNGYSTFIRGYGNIPAICSAPGLGNLPYQSFLILL